MPSEPTLYRKLAGCEGCGSTLSKCINGIRGGAIKCCPDCRHYVPVDVTEDDLQWLFGWVTAGFAEFLGSEASSEAEWDRYFRIEKALGIGDNDE